MPFGNPLFSLRETKKAPSQNDVLIEGKITSEAINLSIAITGNKDLRGFISVFEKNHWFGANKPFVFVSASIN